MNTELTSASQEDQKMQMRYQGGSSEAVYGLGLIGAWVYFIGRAATPQQGIVGFFKGIVWPAILVYKLLELLDGKPQTGESREL